MPRPDMLRALVPLTADPVRADRVRASCRAALEQRRQRSRRAQLVVGVGRRVLPAAIVGLFGLLYVVSLVATTLRVRTGGP